MSTNKSFVHLHNHADGSTLDGLAQISKLVPAAGQLGMPSIAITDHGSQSGTYALYNATKDSKNTEHPVKPIYGCLLAGQEIVTSTGIKNVEDVVIGDMVLTHNGRFRKVLRTMNRPYEGVGYEISLAGRHGRKLSLTEEHPILIRFRDGTVEWVKPGDIKSGRPWPSATGTDSWNSYVCLPKLKTEISSISVADYVPVEYTLGENGFSRDYFQRQSAHWPNFPSKIELNYSFSYLLGIFAAEGALQRRKDGHITGGINFTLHKDEQVYAERITKAINQLGLEVTIYDRSDYNSTQHLQVNSVLLANLLNSLTGSGAKNKRVPSEIISGPIEARKGFVEGLLDGDGKQANETSNPKGQRNLKTASRDLAWGLRTLLADMGFWPTITEGQEVGNFPQGGDKGSPYNYYMVNYAPNRKYPRTLEDEQYVYRPVLEIIKKSITEQVYNFEVEEDNSYISDFILHNCEMYVAPAVSRLHKEPVKWNEGGDDDVSGAGAYTHMTMWAETNKGLHNMFKMSTESFESGFYRKNRIDEDLMQEFGKGIMATTGCPSGEVQTWLRIGNYKNALASAAKFADIFGKENFFVELMDHGLDIEKRVIPDLMRIAKDLNLRTVATNDLHYIHSTDAHTHDALLCIGSGSKLADEKRFRFSGQDFYLKTAEEMRRLWDDVSPEACDTTLLIAERCDATLVPQSDLMPQFPVPAGETEETWLRKQVEEGLIQRYTAAGITPEIRERAEYELGIINRMEFPGYFLVVSDYIKWAKEHEIRVGPGRGSGAGSLVAYATKITELDPIRHKLMFERFLNPERVSMPDFDIDFDDRRRGEVINYVTEKYGADKVVQITTFNTVKAKAAIKDSARVLGAPYMVGDKLSKIYPPPILGRDLSLAEAYDPDNARYDEAAEFRTMVESDPEAAEVVTLARGLEGVKRGHGMHAAGVIMSREPITNIVPLMKRDTNSPLMTQFEYKTCEYLGLIKMDFLGLSNLGTLDEALRQIKKNRGIDLDLDKLSQGLDDQKTYDLLAAGDTIGVFQLDSPPIRSLLKLMAVNSFDDISAVIALYRPGPMGVGAHIEYAERKTGRRPIVPIHRELEKPLEKVLGETFGLVVYQEQVMSIAQDLADFSLGKADELRRAMGKKNAAILAKEFGPFSEGMINNGYSMESIQTLWDVLVPFADYAFNRAHSASYGLISYWTAYLKANFPAEYMSALLTTNSSNKDKLALYLGECRRMGIKVLSPDVNESGTNYSAVGDNIRVGLIGIKGIGEAGINLWVQDRELNGKAKGFGDYLMRAPTTMGSKRSVEALIVGGAFDSFGYPRAALDYIVEDATARAGKAKKAKPAAASVVSLFDDAMEGMVALEIDVPADIPEWSQQVKLAKEREVLGLYVSGHPLAGYEEAIDMLSTHSIAYLRDTETPPSDQVKIAGLVVNVERKVTKANAEPWAIVTVEDFDSGMSVMVFPRSYAEYSDMLVRDEILSFSGRVDKKDDGSTTFAVKSVTKPDLNAAKRKVERQKAEALANPDAVPKVIVKGAPDNLVEPGKQDDGSTAPIRVRVEERQLTEYTTVRFKAVLEEYPGSRPVHLLMKRDDGSEVELELGAGLKVVGSGQLAAEIRALFGGDSVI